MIYPVCCSLTDDDRSMLLLVVPVATPRTGGTKSSGISRMRLYSIRLCVTEHPKKHQRPAMVQYVATKVTIKSPLSDTQQFIHISPVALTSSLGVEDMGPMAGLCVGGDWAKLLIQTCHFH